jgi:hypothetical protein
LVEVALHLKIIWLQPTYFFCMLFFSAFQYRMFVLVLCFMSGSLLLINHIDLSSLIAALLARNNSFVTFGVSSCLPDDYSLLC